MIGIVGEKRKSGQSSFADLIGYMNDKNPERVVFKGFTNIIYSENVVEEMEAVAAQNKRCKDPVMHLILSWREMENPTEKQVKEAAEIALKEMGLEECQAAWSLHADTQNHHLHIAVNRVHPERYNAIDPAGGWTKNAIHRAARKIELAQSWEIEQNGTYYVTAEGKLKLKPEDPAKEKFSKTALDIEAHTAQKSAERIAKETAAPIMRSANTWEELHANLAVEGIEIIKKGSGAVLKIGEDYVKTSTAGRDLSMSKLTAKLGDFEPKSQEIKPAEREPEAIEKVEERDVKAEWESYIEERDKYHTEKKAAQKEFSKRHKEEYKHLKKAHKDQRKDLFKESWIGRGRELNAEKSLLAASQAKDILDLREQQKKEREQLSEKYGRQFDGFKKWLEKEKTPKPSLSFRYTENGAIYTEGGSHDQNKPIDIRSFYSKMVRFGRLGGVAYAKETEQKAAFIDYGRKIVVNDQFSEESILAALQLANQKWGQSICIQGTDEYIKTCLKVAKEHNLRIDNYNVNVPGERAEAQKIENIEQGRELPQMAVSKRETFNTYADAVGAERFRVVVTEFTKAGTKAFIFDKQNGGENGKTKEEISNAMGKFASWAYYHKNINVVPMSADKHHILVDDLTADNLKRLKEDGYRPACVIESSPGNFQALLTVQSLTGESQKDREAANRLTKELNTEYGDKNLSGAVHAHRLPPFANYKPKHERGDGTFPETKLTEANGGICDKALEKLGTLQEVINKEREAIEATRAKAMRESQARAQKGQSYADDPSGAYWAHAKDIMAKTGVDNYSTLDGMIGIRMRVTGYTPTQVCSAIEENAPALRQGGLSSEEFQEKYPNRDWHRYAQETTDKFVFGGRGYRQFADAEPYAPYFYKVEGRDYKAEKAEQKQTQGQMRIQGMGIDD